MNWYVRQAVGLVSRPYQLGFYEFHVVPAVRRAQRPVLPGVTGVVEALPAQGALKGLAVEGAWRRGGGIFEIKWCFAGNQLHRLPGQRGPARDLCGAPRESWLHHKAPVTRRRSVADPRHGPSLLEYCVDFCHIPKGHVGYGGPQRRPHLIVSKMHGFFKRTTTVVYLWYVSQGAKNAFTNFRARHSPQNLG